MTAWLMELERPKSSALTIRRRGIETRPVRLVAIIGRFRAGYVSPPGEQDEQQLFPPAQARHLRAENVEALPLQLAEQRPIDRPHQLGRDHRRAVGGGQGLGGEPIEMTGALCRVVRELEETRRVF